MILKAPYHCFHSMIEDCPSPEVLADGMTQLGHECTLRHHAVIDPNVVVGQIVSLNKHPNADKLMACKVNIGGDETLSIVCGCPSVRENMRVAVARVGACLPDIKIKKAKIRGELSEGMLCSASELGMFETAVGIMDLPVELEIGTQLSEILLFNSAVLEFDITPNRGDCLSIEGLCRDYTSCYGGVYNQDYIAKESSPADLCQSSTSLASSFCAAQLILSGGELPFSIKYTLLQAGFKLIHPVVDTLHYVMLLCGQPMHAYDADKITGRLIAKTGVESSLDLLDGSTINVAKSDIVITDGDRVVGLAGIMGDSASMVTSSTSSIVLECCWFNPDRIAMSNRLHKIQSDAAMRYERGVSKHLPRRSLQLAVSLLDKYGIARCSSIDLCSEVSDDSRPIVLKRKMIMSILGIEFSDAEIERILLDLGCTIQTNDDGWDVSIPGYRYDLKLDVDLIEEIVRVFGYNNIPMTTEIVPLKIPKIAHSEQMLARHLASRGMQEVITYSIESIDQHTYLCQNKDVPVVINPITSQMTHLKSSLLPGLYQVAKRNYQYQKSSHRYFEIANTFSGLTESRILGMLMTGKRLPSRPENLNNTPMDAYDLIAMVSQVVATYSGSEACFEADQSTSLDTIKAKVKVSGCEVGYVMALHPRYDISGNAVMYAELNLGAFIAHSAQCTFVPYSTMPEVIRDITWTSDSSFSAGDLIHIINKYSFKYLKFSYVFDIYQSEDVSTKSKRISTRHIFQSDNETLTDDIVDNIIEDMIHRLSIEQQLEVK